MQAERIGNRQPRTAEQRRRILGAARGFYAGPSRSKRQRERDSADRPIVRPHQDPFGAGR